MYLISQVIKICRNNQTLKNAIYVVLILCMLVRYLTVVDLTCKLLLDVIGPRKRFHLASRHYLLQSTEKPILRVNPVPVSGT